MKRALIFYGGWAGHDPDRVSQRFERILRTNGFEVDRCEGVDVLSDYARLLSYDLLVPCVTMGKISPEQENNIANAVAGGIGLAGCHGGMCDAFRESTLWQFVTGGQWVSHPGDDGVEYEVEIVERADALPKNIKNFKVVSEQYYLHVDPAVKVLATTRFPIASGYHVANGSVDMPVVWTKMWGKGRVFYCSLGHNDALFESCSEAESIMESGMLWAAKHDNTHK